VHITVCFSAVRRGAVSASFYSSIEPMCPTPTAPTHQYHHPHSNSSLTTRRLPFAEQEDKETETAHAKAFRAAFKAFDPSFKKK